MWAHFTEGEAESEKVISLTTLNAYLILLELEFSLLKSVSLHLLLFFNCGDLQSVYSVCCMSSEDNRFYPNTRGTSQNNRKTVISALEKSNLVEKSQGPPKGSKSGLDICWASNVVVVQSLSHVQLLRPHGLQAIRFLYPCDFPS